jgi:hypothetical protein
MGCLSPLFVTPTVSWPDRGAYTYTPTLQCCVNLPPLHSPPPLTPLNPCYLVQVTAEWKKANALIKPGPRANQVWASLYAEIEQVGKPGRPPAAGQLSRNHPCCAWCPVQLTGLCQLCQLVAAYFRDHAGCVGLAVSSYYRDHSVNTVQVCLLSGS